MRPNYEAPNRRRYSSSLFALSRCSSMRFANISLSLYAFVACTFCSRIVGSIMAAAILDICGLPRAGALCASCEPFIIPNIYTVRLCVVGVPLVRCAVNLTYALQSPTTYVVLAVCTRAQIEQHVQVFSLSSTVEGQTAIQAVKAPGQLGEVTMLSQRVRLMFRSWRPTCFFHGWRRFFLWREC